MEKISLASGASYFLTPEPGSLAAVKAIQEHKTYYGLTEGTIALREAIAQRYRQVNKAVVSPDQILITPGTKQALFNVLSNILKPGDEVIVPMPNWFGLHQVLQTLQAQIILWPINPDNNYQLLPADLEKLITSKTRLLLISNPCNPTGRVYPEQEIQALLDVLEQHPHIYLLSDEIYDLVTYGKTIPSLAQFPDQHQRYLVVNGFSKAFAMSGWRIGYLITPPTLYAPCVAFQQTTFSGVSEFVQAAAQAVMADRNNVLPPMLAILSQQRAQILKFLEHHQIPVFRPEAAYYVFPDLSMFLSEAIPTTIALNEYLQENYALEILPGDYFGAPGYARLSFALPADKLNTALERLVGAFEQLIKK